MKTLLRTGLVATLVLAASALSALVAGCESGDSYSISVSPNYAKIKPGQSVTLTASGWDNFSARMRTQSGLEEETLRAIFFFQLNGCLAISKRNIDIPDENWAEIQCQVDRFLKNGLANL
jgi:hypothetical protein